MKTLAAISGSLLAFAVVALLIVIFVMLLASSFIRKVRADQARAAAGEGVRRPAAPASPPAPKAKVVLSRRDFFRGGLLASFLVFLAQFGGASLAFLWPQLKGGFGSIITLTDTPESIFNQITSGRQPFYFGAGRFYLIDYTGNGDTGGGPYVGLTADVTGGKVMALYQKCAHLGCRVPFCQSSQWFECPCHGSKYNYAGEYQLGPAPNGLQRFPVMVDGGQLKVDTGSPTQGPPRGTNTIHQAPEGPFCV